MQSEAEVKEEWLAVVVSMSIASIDSYIRVFGPQLREQFCCDYE